MTSRALAPALLSLAALLPLAGMAAAAPSYTLVDLGLSVPAASPATAYASGRGIAANGTTVSYTAGNNNVAWTTAPNGAVTSLALVSGRNRANPEAVNSSGLAVGSVRQNMFGTILPAFWSGGAATLYALPTGFTNGEARAVNDAGVAAGSVGSGISQRAALFTATGSQTLGNLPDADGFAASTAYGINASGTIVGYAAVNTGPTVATEQYRGYVRAADGTFTILDPSVIGEAGSTPYAINASGAVVGAALTNGGTTSKAFLWTPSGGMIAIPTTAGNRTQARGINASGWVVGQDFTAGTSFLYDGTSVYTLPSLVSDGTATGLTNFAAFGIADDGTIIGQANLPSGVVRAVALKPVPEPASLAALGLGALALFRRRRSS